MKVADGEIGDGCRWRFEIGMGMFGSKGWG